MLKEIKWNDKNEITEGKSVMAIQNYLENYFELKDLKTKIYVQTYFFWIFISLSIITISFSLLNDNIYYVRIGFIVSLGMLLLICYIYNYETNLEKKYEKLGGNRDEL